MKQSKNSLQTLYQLPSSPLKPLDTQETHIFSNSALFYEPTSVLDHHLTSSPAATAAAASAAAATAVHDLPQLPWVVDATLPLVPDENWPDDPVSSWLNCDPFDFHTPQTPPPPPPPPVTNPNPNNSGFERSHFDLLIRAAHAIELCDLHSAHAILARLNPQLNSPSGSPLQRAAFYFKEALRSLVIPCVAADRQSSAAELVRRIAAHRDFSELSPLPRFANFTANQAIIDSLPLDLPSVHFIDFDLGLGGQWSSLIQELSERARGARRPPPRARLTAIVLDGDPLHAAEAALAAEILRDFAATLGIRLAVDLVRAGTLGLGGVRLSPAEPIAVVLSPASLGGLPESTSAVMQFVRRASPRVVVFVDTECGCGDGASVMVPPSFQRSFLGGLEHYTSVLESLDAAAAARDAVEDSIRRVERAVLRPKIEAAVLSWVGPSRPSSWSDFFAGSGFAPAQLSELAESQAEWLLRRCAVEGFRVSRRDAALLLSWHGKELAATSAWRC